ncbi:MAG: DHA1 family drug:H+ antiporter [Roseibaca calidilacus]|uniref:Bcr/CflA family efflux transporter n=1 Tax=Roseibaca calidilacus TaxID=1666912 RepID=A0A0P7W279_9RHOB|nr:multidrug effflux MFS transporter [Roseibaca calidilacus]KPP90039.1 MAG: DHA1 family drug:H+ antiporter [Roseibaca calidilacus]CUX81144.1 MFS transporter, DHA1 family, bicyclomycin/chloramphenicol resistance protein [Roseibaca calidilacus]
MPSAQSRFLDRSTPPHVATLVAQSAIAALAMNVFLPSLPSMAAYFQTDYAVVQLSVSLYLAVNAVLQVFIGALSDRYGRRPVMLAALWVFVLATIGTLLAPNVVVFLLFRMLQAAVVTGIVLSRTAIRDVLGEGDAASRIGYVTMGMAVVPMLAPALGGLLDEAFGWRGSFGLMLIAGIAVLALSWRDMGETRQGGAGTFRAQFAEMPELMRSRRFWGYCATSSFASGAFFAYLGGAPFVGAQVFGMEPAMLGLFFGAPALGYAAGNFLSGRFAARVGIDRMILIGACINFGGMALLSLLYFGGLQNRFVFFGCFIFVGLGNGMILPSATSGMMSVRPHLAGSASGIGGAIMIGAGAALSALAGVLLTPGSGAEPLIAMLFVTTGLAVGSILYVMSRARAIGA